jgi:nucleoside phosphorylase
VFVFAMWEEAEPVIAHLGLIRRPDSLAGLPARLFSLPDESSSRTDVHVAWNGHNARFHGNNVGTTPAAVTTYAVIQLLKPDLVISAGTAGGFQAAGSGTIADVYLSSKCVFHARRIPAAESGAGSAGSGLQQLEESGFAHIRSPPLARLAQRIGAKIGVVSTSDSLDCSSEDLALLRSEGAAVKEMEAASCAWVCQQSETPFFAMKAITDVVDGAHATQQEFYANLSFAAVALKRAVVALIECLAERPFFEWVGLPVGKL